MPTPHKVAALVNEIRLLLQGKGPELQGDVFRWASPGSAGGNDGALAMRQLIPVSEAEMFAHYGKRGLGDDAETRWLTNDRAVSGE